MLLSGLDFKIGQIISAKNACKIHRAIKYDPQFQDKYHYQNNTFERWESFEMYSVTCDGNAFNQAFEKIILYLLKCKLLKFIGSQKA